VSAIRTVFLGTPDFALPVLEGVVRAGAELRAVVCQPDRPRGRGNVPAAPPAKEWANAHGLPVLQPEKVRRGRLRALLEPFEPDVLVVAAYGRILPQEVLSLPRHGALNAHASILPRYRGAAPIHWAVARGEKTTGITIMQMDEGLDTGDIVLVRTLDIGPEETTPGLHDRLAPLAGEAVEQALRMLAAGPLPRVPQDSSQATLAPVLRKEDGFLDLRQGAVELERRVRAFVPWPGTTLFRAGRPLKVHRVRTGEGEGPEPGVVVEAAGSLRIVTGAGLLEPVEVQPEGGRRMGVREYLAGHRLAPGDRFDVPPPGAQS